MKKIMFGLMMLVMVSFLANAAPAQKKSSKARDLFIEKERDDDTGKSGVKFRILLKRGNEAERYVAPDATFYSGDKIKLAFDINFSGYIALLNIGSSGKINLLYPYAGIDAAVEPDDDEQLFPAGSREWITFDDQPGTERISVIFSSNPISDINDVINSAKNKGKISGSFSVDAESQEVLINLNSRSLKRAKSRDLFIETVDDDATYVVAETSLISQPTAFVISLRHEN